MEIAMNVIRDELSERFSENKVTGETVSVEVFRYLNNARKEELLGKLKSEIKKILLRDSTSVSVDFYACESCGGWLIMAEVY